MRYVENLVFFEAPEIGIIDIFVQLQMEINQKLLPTKWILIQI